VGYLDEPSSRSVTGGTDDEGHRREGRASITANGNDKEEEEEEEDDTQPKDEEFPPADLVHNARAQADDDANETYQDD
jgi:hypothetical protein